MYKFLFANNIYNITSRIPHLKNLSTKYSNNRLNLIVSDGKFIDTKLNQMLLKEFKQNYMRYSMATNLIPAQCTLKQILEIIHHYIATRELNKTELLTHYIHMQNFAQMCSGTITELADFVCNPSSVDLRNLCNFLHDKINNMENLITMYLSDELEKDSRSK